MKLSPAAVLAASAAISSMAAVSQAGGGNNNNNTAAHMNATAAAAAATNSTGRTNATASGPQSSSERNQTAGPSSNVTGFAELEFLSEPFDFEVYGDLMTDGDDGEDFDDGASETWIGTFPGAAVSDPEHDGLDLEESDGNSDLFDTLFSLDEDLPSDSSGGAADGCLGSGCPEFQSSMTSNSSFAKRMDWSLPSENATNATSPSSPASLFGVANATGNFTVNATSSSSSKGNLTSSKSV